MTDHDARAIAEQTWNLAYAAYFTEVSADDTAGAHSEGNRRAIPIIAAALHAAHQAGKVEGLIEAAEITRSICAIYEWDAAGKELLAIFRARAEEHQAND
jgi:hypothetical protein